MPDLTIFNDAERAAQAAKTGGTPLSEFSSVNPPYLDYMGNDVLLSLQNPRSNAPAELTFFMIGQVDELLFKLVYEELVGARGLLDNDQVAEALWIFRRVRRELDLLVSTWNVISTLAPTEFATFRDHLGQASGIQSYMYRMLEYILGNKTWALARQHRNPSAVWKQVERAIREPSVYDAAVALLARRGARIPPEVLNRDVAEPYEPNPDVEQAWAHVYRDGDPTAELFLLAEALTDVAEAASRWRALHLLTVERIIGSKPGSGGTNGVFWLRRVSEHRFFPELWSARGLL